MVCIFIYIKMINILLRTTLHPTPIFFIKQTISGNGWLASDQPLPEKHTHTHTHNTHTPLLFEDTEGPKQGTEFTNQDLEENESPERWAQNLVLPLSLWYLYSKAVIDRWSCSSEPMVVSQGLRSSSGVTSYQGGEARRLQLGSWGIMPRA